MVNNIVKVGVNWREYNLTTYLLNDNKISFSTNENNFDYLNENSNFVFENLDKSNVSFTKQEFVKFIKKNDLSIASNGVMYAKDRVNVIPNILTEWFNLRLLYKKNAKESKDNTEYEYFDNRQQVIKILLNTVYGVLGMTGFRFYDLDNAEAITLTGQDIIKYTSKLISNYYKKEFNITVDPVLYGDTDSAYIQIPEEIYKNKTIDEIIEYADFICDGANKGLEKFAKFGLGTSDSVLEFKREKVCKTALLLAKKRYGLNVVDNEGKRVNKISVTGIDIKRSSYPKFFVKSLSSVLESILLDNDEDKTNIIVLKAEKDMNVCNVIDLCKTTSIKGIDKYEKLSTNFTFRKGVPPHGKAAIRYNRLLDHYKCETKYLPITSSDKIKWCYLRQNPLGLPSIALKNENVPDVILDFVSTYIDRKKMYERELKSKIQNFYSVLKWKYPSNSSIKSKEFF